MIESRSTVVLYRRVETATALTTLASAGVGRGPLHAHGPALHNRWGAETAEAVTTAAARFGVTAMVWDGDEPLDLGGVYRLAEETRAGLLVAEWQPAGVSGRDEFADAVLADPPCDLLLVRPGTLEEASEIVVAVGPGPNAPLVGRLASRWARAFGLPGATLRAVDTEREVADARLLCRRLAPDLPARVEVGRDLTTLLAEVASRSGFVALGSSEDVSAGRLAARTAAGQLLRRGDATIVIGRRVTPAPPRTGSDA